MTRTSSKKASVSNGFQELEEIASWFERGDGDLDEGLVKFERAMQIADTLKKRLDEAENTIRVIKKKFDVRTED